MTELLFCHKLAAQMPVYNTVKEMPYSGKDPDEVHTSISASASTCWYKHETNMQKLALLLVIPSQ